GKRFIELITICMSLTLHCFAQAPLPHVDRIFVNANIWTGDQSRPQAHALAVSGDKIIAVGSDQEIKTLADRDTAIVDLQGHLVIPGFQDTHLHFPGPSVNEIDLHGIETLKEFQQHLAEFANSHPSLSWITGHGWAYSAFPNQTVDKRYV